MSRIRVCSFNILTDNCRGEGPRRFSERSKLILDEFLAYEPDLIGFQETQPPQRQWLMDNFTDFEVCGVGRDRDLLGESNVVLYRKSRFDLCFLETFWLSDTPRIPGSRFSTDQSDCPRLLTSVDFVPFDSGEVFRFMNTHLDHIGANARKLELAQVLRFFVEQQAIRPMPTILTGDFNMLPDAEAMKLIDDQGAFTDLSKDVPGTFHFFGKLAEPKKIDYIFGAGQFECCRLDHKMRDGLYLSDHDPVIAEVRLP